MRKQHDDKEKAQDTENPLDKASLLNQWGFRSNSCLCCGVRNSEIGGYLMQCGKCKSATYCSMKCFNKHLPEHQKFCQTNKLDREPRQRGGYVPKARSVAEDNKFVKTAVKGKPKKQVPLDESTSEEEEEKEKSRLMNASSFTSEDEESKDVSEDEESEGAVFENEESEDVEESEEVSEDKESEEETSVQNDRQEPDEDQFHSEIDDTTEEQADDEVEEDIHTENNSTTTEEGVDAYSEEETETEIDDKVEETEEESQDTVENNPKSPHDADPDEDQQCRRLSITKHSLPEPPASNPEEIRLRQADQNNSKDYGWEKPDWAKGRVSLRKRDKGNTGQQAFSPTDGQLKGSGKARAVTVEQLESEEQCAAKDQLAGEESDVSEDERVETTVGIETSTDDDMRGEVNVGLEMEKKNRDAFSKDQRSLDDADFNKGRERVRRNSIDLQEIQLRRVEQNTDKRYGWEKPAWAKGSVLRPKAKDRRGSANGNATQLPIRPNLDSAIDAEQKVEAALQIEQQMEQPPPAVDVATGKDGYDEQCSPDEGSNEPTEKGITENRQETGKQKEQYYNVEDLRKQTIPGLDYKNRQQYLSPQDFVDLFKVTKEEYAAWPKWKQTNAKRKLKLF